MNRYSTDKSGIMLLFLFYCLMRICLGNNTNEVDWEHQEDLFDSLTDPSRYNHRVRPFHKDHPVEVITSIFVYSIASIDEIHTSYSMQILYRQEWNDPRLKFNASYSVPYIMGDDWHASKIWTPTVHVVNNKEIGSLSKDNEGTVLLRIMPNGTLVLSKRVKLKPLCKMEFYRYPLDDQQCRLELESSTLSKENLVLKWSSYHPLDLNNNFYTTGFDLTNYSLEMTETHYRLTGNFSRLVVKLNLVREFGHFLMDIYIPSILIVVTSWTGFWVEIPAAPARVTLGLTSMLTLVTSERAIREKLPKVSYVHALDVWNVVCIAFIFASLVEYAMANYIYHKDKRRKKGGMKRIESTATFASVEADASPVIGPYLRKGQGDSKSHSNISTSKSCNSLSDLASISSHGDITCPWPLDEIKLTPQDIANGIDRKCRFIFPIGFLMFNLIYWLVLWI